MSISEQILGIEFVCVLSHDSKERTRTTTLTPENNEVPQGTKLYILDNIFNLKWFWIRSNFIQGENQNEEQNVNTETTNFTAAPNQFKRSVFFSKFNKFNQKCLLDLIEEKDTNEFKNIIKQLENQQVTSGVSSQSDAEDSSETLPLLISDVKIYLRFNW